MGYQANKPGGNYLLSGEVWDVADLQAVKNQAVVHPDDYPEKASGAQGNGRRKGEERLKSDTSADKLRELAQAERDAGVPDLPVAKAAAEATRQSSEEND